MPIYRYGIFLFGTLSLAAIDQFTKYLTRTVLTLHQPVEIIPHFFRLLYVENSGVAFGLFAEGSSSLKAVFFIVISALAMAMIAYLYSRVQQHMHRQGMSIAYIMIMGGAMGNLLDRVRFGSVVDFLDFYVGGYHWPAFNIADSFITSGMILVCYYAVVKKVPI
ncbi:MAG: signal peptidase II [Pseudomonadota bacterium]